MLKLLIIDDEPVIREGLKSIIPWGDYGYEICDVGVDGQDGLNKIRLHHPDLVLLDIRMPGITGIELLRQVRKEKYTSKFIVLTAYSSFAYAKELMGLGIESYLLKPIDEDELIQILESISHDREEERKLQDQLLLYNRMNEEKTLKALLDGKLDYISENVIEAFNDKEFQVASIYPEIKRVNYHWLVDEVAQNADQIKLLRKDNHYHLLFVNEEESIVKDFLFKVQKRLRLFDDEHTVLMLGSSVNKAEEIATSYIQAKELIDVYFCFSDKNIFIYNELDVINKEREMSLKKINKEKLYHYLEFGDKKSVHKEVLKLEVYYQSVRYSKERIKAELIEWVVSIFKIISKNYPKLAMTSKDILEKNINKQSNLQDIIGYIYIELTTIGKKLNGYYTVNGNIVDKVIRFVNYYYHEDISLKLVADLFHYNSAYLGKIFRNQTGEFFNVYLHQVRIKNAKKLLLEKQYKVYEISKQVGYSNSDYFYKNFKQYEGISPKEYQMKYSN